MYRSSFRPQLLENRPPVRPKRIDREQCDVPVFGVQPSKRRRERQQANTYRVQGRPDDCPKRRWANTKRALHQHPPVLPAPAIRSAPFTILLAIIQGYLPSKECAGAPATFVSSNSVSVFNAFDEGVQSCDNPPGRISGSTFFLFLGRFQRDCSCNHANRTPSAYFQVSTESP